MDMGLKGDYSPCPSGPSLPASTCFMVALYRPRRADDEQLPGTGWWWTFRSTSPRCQPAQGSAMKTSHSLVAIIVTDFQTRNYAEEPHLRPDTRPTRPCSMHSLSTPSLALSEETPTSLRVLATFAAVPGDVVGRAPSPRPSLSEYSGRAGHGALTRRRDIAAEVNCQRPELGVASRMPSKRE